MRCLPWSLLTASLSSSIGAFYYQAVGHTVFAVGRFLSAIAGLLVAPREILLFLFAGLIVTSALAMNLTGDAGVAMIILIYFFEVSHLHGTLAGRKSDEYIPVRHLFHRLRHVSSRPRNPNQDGINLPHRSNIGRCGHSWTHEPGNF